MQLEIKPTNKFGLEYYQVVSVSDPHPIVIAEFMSLQGAQAYVRRITYKTKIL